MSEREEYTPDTGAVRAAYTRAMRQAFIASTSEHIEEFDRWLAAHDRALREQIARDIEAHATAREDVLFERMRDPLPGDYVAKGNTDGLRLAARIARGEDQTDE